MIKAVIIIGIIIGLVFLFMTNLAFQTFIYIILGVIALWLFLTYFIKKYDETERAIIFRLGKFNRVAGPGAVRVSGTLGDYIVLQRSRLPGNVDVRIRCEIHY